MKKFLIWMNIIYEKAMLFVFIVALLIICYGLYDAYYVYHKASDNDYLKYKPVVGETVLEESPITQDMVAWITIDGTNIDYPIMQSDSNTEYLNKDPYGEYSLSGSIFLDSRNSSDFSDPYSILYGHHMEYGKMFGALDDYLKPEYLNKYNNGTLMIGRDAKAAYPIRLFACVKVSAYDDNALEPGTMDSILKVIDEHAEYINTSIEKSEHIIALSTCTEPVSTNRLIVFGYIYE